MKWEVRSRNGKLKVVNQDTRYKNIYFSSGFKCTTLFDISLKAIIPTQQRPRTIHIIKVTKTTACKRTYHTQFI